LYVAFCLIWIKKA